MINRYEFIVLTKPNNSTTTNPPDILMACMDKSKVGGYVKYSDYDTEIAYLKSENSKIREGYHKQTKEIAELKIKADMFKGVADEQVVEIAELKEELNSLDSFASQLTGALVNQ